ncbi:MAG: CcmD family protein [Chloroflexi bacterium]|nr:CcmD family protein [Chloroflexota bacterium]
MKIKAGAALVFALLTLAGATALAIASGEPQAVGEGARAAQQQTNPNTNLGYLFWVYIITWAGFFAYIFLISRRQRELEREIKQLRQILEQRSRGG